MVQFPKENHSSGHSSGPVKHLSSPLLHSPPLSGPPQVLAGESLGPGDLPSGRRVAALSGTGDRTQPASRRAAPLRETGPSVALALGPQGVAAAAVCRVWSALVVSRCVQGERATNGGLVGERCNLE